MRRVSPPPAPHSPAKLAMPRPRRRHRPVEERPPPHWFTIGSLRRLGQRLGHPPPPAKEEHYKWLLSPRFEVPLQEVIEDKHLAPLSRQDFEDFLQCADGSIEILYFYEWVRNYRELYREWADSVLPNTGTSSSSRGVYRSRDLWERLKDCQDRRLREEFASAKAWFFEQGAPYRLNIDNDLIDRVLNIPNHPPRHGELTHKLPSFPNQPEPSIFDPIQELVDAALEEAFVRFRRLAFCNSGLWHHCVGHSGGAVILACGLALYSIGIMSRSRDYVGGSLPIIWFGIWFMLVSANGHCLVVYVTGDARQLYPHEMARPLPADAVPPRMYSLALAPNDLDSTYSFSRKASTTSNLLPLIHTPALPRPSYHPLTRLTSQMMPDKPEFQLPPPRQTKNLPRSSLAVDVGLDLRVDHTRVEWPERAESPELYNEDNDFGIKISDAYEEEVPVLFPTVAEDRPAPAHSFEEPIHFISGTSPEPLAPLIQAPEYAAQRRRTVLDYFESASRRGIMSIEPEMDIPLSDFSGHLSSGPEDVPEWERMELPFNLPVIAPSVNNAQPSTWSLKPTAITNFPSRLNNAPPRPSLPLKKRFTVVPEYDIPLPEILDDIHASPLSLREFEEYLLYVERSVENLQYTQTYRDWERRVPPAESSSRAEPPINVPLANSFQRARRLFFDPSSQYELNVTDDQIDPIRQWVKPARTQSRRVEAWEEPAEPEPTPKHDIEVEPLPVHPHPDSFQRVLTEIEGTLRQSLTRFFQLSFTNSGRSHDKLGYSIWLIYLLASIATSISLIINHKHRALRLVVTPMLLLGWTVGLSTYNGICPAIFAFGDARQMYPYEIFVLKCRMFVQNPYEAGRIDWKCVGEANKDVTSADPIIPPKRTYRAPRPSRLFSGLGRKRPTPDVERGRESTGFGFRVEAEPEQAETPMPEFPSPAYIPGSSTRMHKHPWTPTTAAFGGFDIYTLRPQPRRSTVSGSCETELEMGEEEFARELGLDLRDPRALGFYGHMVTIPNPLVRHVHREIFVRAFWLAMVVTIPIMVILLVIP
ncbi:unnamed protein product [Rhizoctonia solani]|uniref:RGS domain-containing protein n=1 Tax=Rhizoctonia solani TaxID=456999 RepID=A0A8H3HQV0_9AGAM|nr:unnamed protein product [Rhizoctonia solani]